MKLVFFPPNVVLKFGYGNFQSKYWLVQHLIEDSILPLPNPKGIFIVILPTRGHPRVIRLYFCYDKMCPNKYKQM